MFDIFVKRKKRVVDFFTIIPQVYEDGKPVAAIKVLPDWFTGPKMKEIQRQARRTSYESTIRTCPGIIDLYKESIAMTSWFNYEIDISPEGEVCHQEGNFGKVVFNSHNRNQFLPFVEHTTSTNLKMNIPWEFKCKKDTTFILTEPTWHSYDMYDRISVLPGILRSSMMSFCNVNYITRPGSVIRRVSFHPGDPLSILTPLTEDKVDIKTHLITQDEAAKLKLFRPRYGISRPPEHKQFEQFIQHEHDNQTYDRAYHNRIVSKLKRIHGED